MKRPVRVVVYEDLQCPDSAAYRAMLEEKLLPAYGSAAVFEQRDFPLGKHDWARKAAIAARFFQEIDPAVGSGFRSYALRNLREITAENFTEKLFSFSRRHGIDPALAVAALDEEKYAGPVEADYQEGIARGVSRTPTVFVNAERFVEKFAFEDIAKAIDTALAALKH
ncbi:MAG TPA: thioredoxin domain-containing protein [Bryobacteraceae bacterium]|nr:thioredoxin domain-containing protein [Bryobacteraceae bacterium]